MNKKRMLLLVLISLPASFVCFYATNLILSDVANMFYMTLTKDVISSLPIFLIAAELVAVTVCILNCGLYPKERTGLLLRNAIFIAVLSLAGAVCAVLTGSLIYGSFTAPYPFPGATLLSLAYHLLSLAGAVCVAWRCRRPEKVRHTLLIRFARAAQWVLLVVFTYYAFDRCGAVLWLPTYVQTATFGKTFVFYLSLLLPVCLLLHHCRYRLKCYRNWRFEGILYPAVYLAADLLLCIAVVMGGVNDTQFVAAISPALGIERLLGKPVVTIAHFSLLTGPILGNLIFAIVKTVLRRRKKAARG